MSRRPEPVWIVGAGMTALGKHLTRSIKDLTREAVDLALDEVQVRATTCL